MTQLLRYETYYVQPISLTILDELSGKQVILLQDKSVRVLEISRGKVKVLYDNKHEYLLSLQGLAFAVSK